MCIRVLSLYIREGAQRQCPFERCHDENEWMLRSKLLRAATSDKAMVRAVSTKFTAAHHHGKFQNKLFRNGRRISQPLPLAREMQQSDYSSTLRRGGL